MTTMNSMNVNSHAAGIPPVMGAPHRKAVFVINEKMTPDGTRSFWTRIGAAFDNKDGSVTVRLDALPLSGTLQIREDDRDQSRRDRAAQAPF